MSLKRLLLAVSLVLLVLAFPQRGVGADWPMWRYDAARTAVTPEELPAQLHLQWVRELPAPRSAWPKSQYKLQFDASYEPVVMGKTIFVPSMVSDNVTAYDTETGAEKWRFYTDGPVRFAPVAYRGKVYFICDDGYLYCLDAASGALVWKFRGGPDGRTLIGNDRLVNMWLARGGPVLYEGKLYFAAGIWPFMGTFIYALDPETREPVWTNSGSGPIYMNQQHTSPAFAGVAPQGYFAATEDRLMVSGGRTVPAAYDRTTGDFLYYHLSSRQFGNSAGGYEVTAAGRWFFNGGVIYNLEDGAGVLRVHPGIYTAGVVYFSRPGDRKLVAEALPPVEIEETDAGGKARKRIVLKQLWEATLSPAAERYFIKAGNRLYGGSRDGTVVAVDLGADGTASVSWHVKVEGAPWSMLAADGKLFVVTAGGRLYCFGARGGEPKTYALESLELPAVSDAWTARAKTILDGCGTSEGYCVALGLGTGRLVEELLKQSAFHIVVVEPDARKVDAFRRRMDTAGVYGTRVVAHVGDPFAFPFPPYLASLIVSEDLAAAGFDPKKVEARRVFEPLRPYGGVAYLPVGRGGANVLMRWARGAALENAQVSRAGRFVLLRRAGPLPGSASWTHQYADAGNSVVSKDTLVRAPLGLLWFGGPPNDPILPRHGHGPSPQVVGGRLFIEGGNLLRAVDVYTGRLLWEKELPGIGKPYGLSAPQVGANQIGSNYVSVEDGVYVMSPRSCLRLDPATGATVKEFTLPTQDGEEPPRWGFISVWEDVLAATASPIAVPLRGAAGAGEPVGKMEPVIKKNAEWHYLAGSHPDGAWTQPDFKPEGWKTGPAGFGYGDNDDKTVLKDMPATYTAVYVRRAFTVDDVGDIRRLALMISYDDAFIAYVNGKEVLRVGVGKGSGADASGVAGHEVQGYQYFDIKNAGGLLRKGTNVLAIEGHNVGPNSSDFTLDPYLAVLRKGEAKDVEEKQPAALGDVPGATLAADYASASRTLVVMDRKSGEILWTREATYAFRHNGVVFGGGKLFCIDGLPKGKMAELKRRGILPDATPVLYALDARTGEVVWQTDENVFGTWLGYSEEHDVLLQAGRASWSSAGDEVGRGMIVYRGKDGTVVWADLAITYNAPCMIRRDTILTQGVRHGLPTSGAYALDLLTGERLMRKHPLTGRPIPWTFSRQYGCNTAIASEHLVLFRSAAAGYTDIEHDGGTGNLGGFRAGCTSNLIVADGVLNAPDYTRTCTCSYQIQASVAAIHMPDVEMWTFNEFSPPRDMSPARIKRVGINLGAPGDRRAGNGTLWLDYPSVGGPSPNVPVTVSGPKTEYFRRHASVVKGPGLAWVGASGVEGLTSVTVGLYHQPPAGPIGDTFSIRWTGTVQPEHTETYTFLPRTDDGVRLWVDGKLIVDGWRDHPPTEVPGTIDLKAGVTYPIKMEYYDGGYSALAELRWSSPSTPKALIPKTCLFSDDGRPGGLTGTYYDNVNFTGPSMKQVDPVVSFDWGMDAPQPILKLHMPKQPDEVPARPYTVRLYFAEPKRLKPGRRVFDVAIQGKEVLKGFDVAKEAGGPRRTVVKEFKRIALEQTLQVTLTPGAGGGPGPVLCGIEIVAEGW